MQGRGGKGNGRGGDYLQRRTTEKDTVLGETAFSPQAPAATGLSAISRGFQGSDSKEEARASWACF